MANFGQETSSLRQIGNVYSSGEVVLDTSGTIRGEVEEEEKELKGGNLTNIECFLSATVFDTMLILYYDNCDSS